MRESTKLQVRMSPDLLRALKQRADELGFSSVPAYVRFWATAETGSNDHRLALDKNSLVAIRYFELMLGTKRTPTRTPEQAVEYVIKRVQSLHFSRYLKSIGMRSYR